MACSLPQNRTSNALTSGCKVGCPLYTVISERGINTNHRKQYESRSYSSHCYYFVWTLENVWKLLILLCPE